MSSKRLLVAASLMGIITTSLVLSSSVGLAERSRTDTIFSPQIEAMLDQVALPEVIDLTKDLSGEQQVEISAEPYTIATRTALSGEPNSKAVQYLFEYYEDLGLQVSLQDFNYSGHRLSNVVAEKTGTIFPERIYMVTSHMDNMPSSGKAPGADDNASGTVGVMMAAEILKQYEFGCTLRFINFNAEEYGLIGSQKYARQTYCAGEEVRGVINLDMIAWNTAGSPAEMDLHALPSIPGSMEIAGLFKEVVSAYGLDLQPTNATSPTSASDHASFWRYNYPAILASEDFADFNDFYHSSQDSLGNLPDMNYYTEMVKASLGTLAHMGCLVEGGRGTVSGTIREEATNLSIPGAQVTLHNPEWGYTLLANSDQDGHYQISAPAGWHEISADAHGYAFLPPSDIYINQSQAVQENLALDSMAEIAYFFPVLYNSIPIPAGCP